MKHLLGLTVLLLCLFPPFGGIAYGSTLTYQPIVSLSTPTISPRFLAVADFNADGKPDIAVPDYLGKTVAVYLNQGRGSFGAPVTTTLSINGSLVLILAGDFNEDGKADLAVGTVAGSQVVIVLLGNGDGSFVAQPPIPGSFGFLSGKVADFNADGHQDLFLGGNGLPYLFLGKGDGSFAEASVGKGSPGGEYLSVTAGDFNGDGKLDGLAVDSREGSSVDFFPGDGNGSLGNAVLSQSDQFFVNQSVDAADLNGDGKLDLLAAGAGAAGGVLGNGDGTFQVEFKQLIPIYGQDDTETTDAIMIKTADLDQDGHPDAIVLNCTTGLVSLSLNDGTGAFPPTLNTPYTYQFSAVSYGFATADFNGDGLPDVVVSNETAKTISLLLSVKPLVKPAISLNSSDSSALVGTALTIKAMITGGMAPATGTVSLSDGSSQIAQQALDSSGNAVFNVATLGVGTHPLTLSYSGDSNYAAGTSASLNQSVTDFQVGLTPVSQAVTAGASATYMFTVTPLAGFTGSVNFVCSGLPSLSNCTVSPVTIGSTAVSGTITVSTTATTTAVHMIPTGATLAYVFLGCISLSGLRRRRRTPARRIFFLSFLSFALFCGPIACGGGGAKQTAPGTPVGMSTITVTATATQNGVTVNHLSSTTLVVQ